VNALSTTLHQLLADNLPLCADTPALVDSGGATSYAALTAEIDALGGYLRDRGAFETYVGKVLVPELKRGDVVMTIYPATSSRR
jgi:acyl-CoA synthetase (AMP-forming)/AMP-acid ligase II